MRRRRKMRRSSTVWGGCCSGRDTATEAEPYLRSPMRTIAAATSPRIWAKCCGSSADPPTPSTFGPRRALVDEDNVCSSATRRSAFDGAPPPAAPATLPPLDMRKLACDACCWCLTCAVLAACVTARRAPRPRQRGIARAHHLQQRSTWRPRWPRRRRRRHARMAGHLELAATRQCYGSAPVRAVRRRGAGSHAHARGLVAQRRAAQRGSGGAATGSLGVRAAAGSLALLAARRAGSERRLRSDAQ